MYTRILWRHVPRFPNYVLLKPSLADSSAALRSLKSTRARAMKECEAEFGRFIATQHSLPPPPARLEERTFDSAQSLFAPLEHILTDEDYPYIIQVGEVTCVALPG